MKILMDEIIKKCCIDDLQGFVKKFGELLIQRVLSRTKKSHGT